MAAAIAPVAGAAPPTPPASGKTVVKPVAPGNSGQRISPPTYDTPADYFVHTGDSERFYEISFDHRIAYVRADDVQVVR